MKIIDETFLNNRYIALCINTDGKIIDERIMSSNIDGHDLAVAVLEELQSSTHDLWRLYKINDTELIY